ncbi:hypothetical protein [Amycolatopsis thermophila]|uniref:Uncharacterized protein n=1 Tax=Amycolatopsis thermophila TaxID=206084 RepID=A0ABU0F5B3_9PSEU|nr:hypothetical protein [Amycolatopsis thermophila]MDQ0382678.1 hypothetical protein [Amycolatopsis thermophila]
MAPEELTSVIEIVPWEPRGYGGGYLVMRRAENGRPVVTARG